MKRVLVLALVIGACDEPPPPPPPGERVAPEQPPPPDDIRGALPVELPSVAVGQTVALSPAPAFVVLTSGGEVSVGRMGRGLRPEGGAAVKTEQIAETVATLLGDHVGPGTAPIVLRAVTAREPVEVLALIDASATAATFVPAVQQVGQRRMALAVRANARVRRLAYITGAGYGRGAPVHLEVTASGVSIYGTAHAWGDVGPAVEDLVATHKRSSSMSVLADLAIAPTTPVERVVALLGVLAASGIAEAQLTVDPALAPVRPSGVFVTRDGGVPRVSIGQPSSIGDLDKAIIRRYIKRNVQKVLYCYEKQLLASPEIAGTVMTQFFIAPTGHVAQASASGVHPDVARCVAGVIKGIEFPRPKGGGGVQVNYPFTFRPDGG